MKNQFLLFLVFIPFLNLFAQQRIDDSFAFQTDPAKKYSIYVPSGYDANVPHTMMLGLHPLNTSRWDSESWCDTLINFAETNNLLLVCPDGGIDGAIDDPIDTAFTTVLLDSMETWYNVDSDRVYAMGFSWGGKTVYTYGLNHIDRFKGFMPIGAAITLSEISGVESNAAWHPYYIVHGGNDSPNIRYAPLKNAMEDNDACVNSILMNGVGHTIDFPNRNQILTNAFIWIDSVNCAATTSTIDFQENQDLNIFPNPISPSELLQVEISSKLNGNLVFEIISTDGKVIQQHQLTKTSNEVETIPISISNCPKGIYFLRVSNSKGKMSSMKFQVK